MEYYLFIVYFCFYLFISVFVYLFTYLLTQGVWGDNFTNVPSAHWSLKWWFSYSDYASQN